MVESTKDKKKAKQSTFTICTAEARIVKPLLQEIIRERGDQGWKETISKENYDLKWHQSKITDEELLMSLNTKGHIANRFPGIQGLAHKDYYSRIMNMGRLIDPEVLSFEPNQFIFPQDQDLFKEYHKANKNKGLIYIAKPVASSEGNSIMLFKELNEIPSFLSQEMVVQRYIQNPLLVNGLKFDLRVYVVIVGTNPLSAFICNEGLARFCTEKYEQPTKENFKQVFMHLTNYSINKHSDDYIESENILGINNATKRTFTSLFQSLSVQGVDVKRLIDNINKCCMNALAVYAPIIEHQLSVVTNCKPVDGKFFQILGFDVLPDEDLNCYLLEINDHPSLDIYLEKDYMGGGGLKTLSQIDLFVKKKLVEDTLNLIKKKKSSILEKPSFGSLYRILPYNQDTPASQMYETLNKVRSLYYRIAPIKSKLTLTSSNFEKLLTQSASLPFLQYKSADLNLLFQKVSKAEKLIDFITFFWLIIALRKDMIVRCQDQGANYAHIQGQDFLVFIKSEFFSQQDQ